MSQKRVSRREFLICAGMVTAGLIAAQSNKLRLHAGDHCPKAFGEERSDRIVVPRGWMDAGVDVALGSDAPTTPWYAPQITLAGAVSRPPLSNEIFGPEHCMTIQEAMREYTMGSAYATFEEDIKGSIEVGKLADLIVWKHGPYTSTLKEHGSQPVDMTIVGGEMVYQA